MGKGGVGTSKFRRGEGIWSLITDGHKQDGEPCSLEVLFLPANRLELTIQATFACHHSVIYIRHFHYNTLGHSTVGGVWRLLLASPVKAAAIAGPPRRPGWAWLARCYWRSKKQNISKRKTDILESQRAIFMIQQLWIGQKKKNQTQKGELYLSLEHF